MGDRWWHEHQRDPWRAAAKREGHRARSAYKLLQLQRRHSIVRPGDAVLDVGCHPGGWTQVAVELAGEEGTVVGIDLRACEALEGATFLVGNATAEPTLTEACALTPEGRFNAVISDISPQLTGTWSRDQAISLDLVARVIDAVLPVMAPGASFVTKVFQGRGIEALVSAMRQRFSHVKRSSPGASRKSSAEVYVVAKNLLPWVPVDERRRGSIASEVDEAQVIEADRRERRQRRADRLPDLGGGFRVVRRRTNDDE